MSKCKPTETLTLAELFSKGVRLEDVTERSERYVVIKIPYEALLKDPDVQRVFQEIVTISSTEEEGEN